jgi:hypothetical protein
METITANLAGKTRRSTLNGREYIVAPMTLIVPGVLPGSKGPLYYPQDELAKDPHAWNHMPVVVNHPFHNGRPVSARRPDIIEKFGIGFVFNTEMNTKLIAEGWFDVEKTRQVDKRILNSLEASTPLELSTGLFTKDEPAHNGAAYNGTPYVATARDYRPDHLAILPDQQGACGIRDGCGVLVNSIDPAALVPGDVTERVDIDGEPGWRVVPVAPVGGWHQHTPEIYTELTANASQVGNELSHSGISRQLEKALWARFKSPEDLDRSLAGGISPDYESVPWLIEVFDEYVVYSKDGKTWALGYTVDHSNNQVSLEDGEPEEVTRVTEYVPVKNEDYSTFVDLDSEEDEIDYSVVNAFCRTGEGGGIDPTCSPHKGGGGIATPEAGRQAVREFTAALVAVGQNSGKKEDVSKAKEVAERIKSSLPKASKETLHAIADELTGKYQTAQLAKESAPKLRKRIVDTVDRNLGGVLRGLEGVSNESSATQNAGKKLPSRSIKLSPAKACKILKDGQVNGRPLTKRQRGLFGAICGRGGSTRNAADLDLSGVIELLEDEEEVSSSLYAKINSFCATGPGGGIDPSCSPKGAGGGGGGHSDPDHGITESTPVHDKQVYRGGPAHGGSVVTYHTTSQEAAQSYVEMFKDRFGKDAEASVHDTSITISKPAPYHVIKREAEKHDIDNDDYTPASVFDSNLHGESEVKALVSRLKAQGYDGAILEDMPYGHQDLGTIKAYVTFTGAKKTATPASTAATAAVTKVISEGTKPAAKKETARVTQAANPKDKKQLSQLKKSLKELEHAERLGILSDKSAPARYRKFISDLEKKITGNSYQFNSDPEYDADFMAVIQRGWDSLSSSQEASQEDEFMSILNSVTGAAPAINAFCKTGPGGGIDPSCSPGGKGGGSLPAETQQQMKKADAASKKADAESKKANKSDHPDAHRKAAEAHREAAMAASDVSSGLSKGLGPMDSPPPQAGEYRRRGERHAEMAAHHRERAHELEKRASRNERYSMTTTYNDQDRAEIRNALVANCGCKVPNGVPWKNMTREQIDSLDDETLNVLDRWNQTLLEARGGQGEGGFHSNNDPNAERHVWNSRLQRWETTPPPRQPGVAPQQGYGQASAPPPPPPAKPKSMMEALEMFGTPEDKMAWNSVLEAQNREKMNVIEQLMYHITDETQRTEVFNELNALSTTQLRTLSIIRGPQGQQQGQQEQPIIHFFGGQGAPAGLPAVGTAEEPLQAPVYNFDRSKVS